jgi:general secretion pathway protein D
MVRAVIVTVDHQDLTSLGVQLASDRAAFGQLNENAVTALNQLSFLEDRGAFVLSSGMDVTFLVDFLMKRTNAKILNQQTLWTKDNEEASFFKGDTVPFQESTSVTGTGIQTSSFVFERVGMTLAVRPSITPERNVDMIVTILLSQLTGVEVNSQPLRSLMETQTNMIVQDGQTLMLGGMLFQRDSETVRKIPLLGDLPLLGPIFRHYDNALINNELIVFITPYVIDEDERLPEETANEIAGPKQRLGQVREELSEATERLRNREEE